MNASSIITLTSLLTIGVILLGWLGSAMDGRPHKKNTGHVHNA